MNAPSIESTVGDLVVEKPGRSRVFQKLGIDFCCGGKKTLAQVCRERNLEPAEVLAQLTSEAGPEGRSSWADAPLAAVCDHVESKHHGFLRSELPRLQAMVDKVTMVFVPVVRAIAALNCCVVRLRLRLGLLLSAAMRCGSMSARTSVAWVLALVMLPALAGVLKGRQAMKEGMHTLRLSGAQKIAAGLTTLEEVLRVAPPAEKAN